MNEIPKPVREFSKENAQEERNILAQDIHEKRKERQVQQEKKEDLETSARELSGQIEELSSTQFSKITNYIKLYKLRLDLESLNSSTKDLVVPDEFAESKKKIVEFYKAQEEKWNNFPYEASDVEKYFNTEHLKTLMLDDYVSLLKRFNSDMVTHVTRQGVRDHFGMMEHSAGVGKASNCFKDMLESGKVKHLIARSITNDDVETEIADFLGLDDFDTEEKAMNALEHLTDEKSQHFAGSFVDFHSVHFAVKSVADEYYGAESGNEIFFAYPSLTIAANYFHRRNPHTPMDASNYNDLWVYVPEDDEIHVDAGIAFIPKDSRVDSETGSLYEIGSNREGIPDERAIVELTDIVTTSEFKEFVSGARKTVGACRLTYDQYASGLRSNSEDTEKIRGVLERLKAIHPTIDEEAIETILDYRFLYDIESSNSNESVKKAVSARLAEMGRFYKKAEKTISSEEYWENYFKNNPKKRPSKIVYYEGKDPTNALENWKTQNGLYVQKPAVSLKQRLFENTDQELPSRIKDELSRFRSIAEKVIRSRFERREI